MALLHSFWYEAAEAAFLEIAEADPECAMAHWGVAMTAVHPLWPGTPNYEKGKRATAKAVALGGGTPQEKGHIDAVSKIFVGPEPPDYPAREKAFERVMADLHAQFPDDSEIAIFYALALTATAPPEDKNYTNQRKAASLLDGLAPSLPKHPGILHYTIHAYDAPELAEEALDVARRYSEVASSVPHGLHMSSHIFTRLGLWEESVATNSSASRAGHRFASELGLAGAWDEELHAMGSARTMEPADARGHIAELESLRDGTENAYWSRQIEVLRREAAAWLVQAKGDSDAALRLLESAVTPGPVLPAREQLGELLVAMGRPAEGLSAFEAALAAAPNRFNGLYGAGIAARDMGDTAKARDYFATLVAMCDGSRPELDVARRFLED